jgi:hypothetical protein
MRLLVSLDSVIVPLIIVPLQLMKLGHPVASELANTTYSVGQYPAIPSGEEGFLYMHAGIATTFLVQLKRENPCFSDSWRAGTSLSTQTNAPTHVSPKLIGLHLSQLLESQES